MDGDEDDSITVTPTEVVTESISAESGPEFEENGNDNEGRKTKPMENDKTKGMSKCTNFAEIHTKAAESKKPIAVSPRAPLRTKGLVCEFGGRGSGAGQFIGLQGIKVMSNGDLLLCEHNNGRLQSSTVGGQYRKTITFPKLYDFRPYDVALSENGHLNITDFGNKHVIVCDENGKLIRCLGNGKIKNPIGVSVNPINGRVYVVDNKGHCVLIYNQDGSYIRSFGSLGSNEGQFRYPRYVFVDHGGNVYVSDCVNGRVQVFDDDDRFLFAFGHGELLSPTGLAVDKHGYVYVTDNYNNNILKYDRKGDFVCRIDDTSDGLKNPTGICVTDDLKVAVCDYGNYCIKVFSQ